MRRLRKCRKGSSSSPKEPDVIEMDCGNAVPEDKEGMTFDDKLSHLDAVVEELKSVMAVKGPNDGDFHRDMHAKAQKKIGDLEKANKELLQKLELAKAQLAKYREGLPRILRSKARKLEQTPAENSKKGEC